MDVRRWKGHTLLLGVLVLVGTAWAAVARAGFFWDDRFLVVGNPALEHFQLDRVLSVDLWEGAAEKVGRRSPYFRPLMTLSLVADQRLFGEAPAGYHLHNLAWHLAAVAALFALVKPRLGPGRAAVAALLFGLHPIQSEAVAWVAARNDLLCAAFALTALAAFDRRRDLLGGLAVLGACLSKEAGVLVPVFLVLWRAGWSERPRAREVGAAGIAAATFLALRARAEVGSVVPAPMDPEILAALPAKLVVTCLRWLVVPWPLTGSASAYMPAPGVLAWAAACVAIALLFLAVRGEPRRGLALLGIAALAWAPTLASTAATHAFGERFLYLPLAAVAVLVAGAAPDTRVWRRVGAVAALGAIALVNVRLPDWQDETRMWEQAAARAPDPYSLARLGDWREEIGDVQGAFRAWHAAMQAEPLLRQGCAEPVRMLVQAGAADKAVAMSEELVARGCTATDFKGWRFKALIGAGRLVEAGKEAPPAPWREDEVPYVAALCYGLGDYTCATSLALRWPDGAGALRGRMFEVAGE